MRIKRSTNRRNKQPLKKNMSSGRANIKTGNTMRPFCILVQIIPTGVYSQVINVRSL